MHTFKAVADPMLTEKALVWLQVGKKCGFLLECSKLSLHKWVWLYLE